MKEDIPLFYRCRQCNTLCLAWDRCTNDAMKETVQKKGWLTLFVVVFWLFAIGVFVYLAGKI